MNVDNLGGVWGAFRTASGIWESVLASEAIVSVYRDTMLQRLWENVCLDVATSNRALAKRLRYPGGRKYRSAKRRMLAMCCKVYGEARVAIP